MRTSVLAIVAVMAASSAMAEDTTTMVNPLMTGELSLNFAETADNNVGGTMALDLDINAADVATVDLGLKATDGNAVTLDTWTVGTSVAGVALSFGDDHNLMPETAANAAAEKAGTKGQVTSVVSNAGTADQKVFGGTQAEQDYVTSAAAGAEGGLMSKAALNRKAKKNRNKK